MNKVILMGRLTRDPEIRAAGETKVANYTLAVDRKRQSNNNENNADFIRCVEFGKNADFAEKYLRQGTKIVISGHIQTGSYTNKDGQKVYTTDVVVEEHDFAESRNSSGNAQGAAPAQGYPQAAPAGAQSGYQQAGYPQGMPVGNYPSSIPTGNNGDGFMNIPEGLDEDLPFN